MESDSTHPQSHPHLILDPRRSLVPSSRIYAPCSPSPRKHEAPPRCYADPLPSPHPISAPRRSLAPSLRTCAPICSARRCFPLPRYHEAPPRCYADSLLPSHPSHFSSETITRAKFEDLCADLFRKTMLPVERVLEVSAAAPLPPPETTGREHQFTAKRARGFHTATALQQC